MNLKKNLKRQKEKLLTHYKSHKDGKSYVRPKQQNAPCQNTLIATQTQNTKHMLDARMYIMTDIPN